MSTDLDHFTTATLQLSLKVLRFAVKLFQTRTKSHIKSEKKYYVYSYISKYSAFSFYKMHFQAYFHLMINQNRSLTKTRCNFIASLPHDGYTTKHVTQTQLVYVKQFGQLII